MPIVTVTVEQNENSLTTTHSVVRGHEVLIDRPLAKEGTDLGMMGGELLLVALGGCFMSNLLEAVRTRQAPITGIQATVAGELGSGPARFTDITMTITAVTEDKPLLEKLVLMSERACIVANSLKGGVNLTVAVA